MVKNPPDSAGAMRRRFDPWGREDPLEKEIVAHSSITTWKIPWTKETGRVTVHKVTKESGMT